MFISNGSSHGTGASSHSGMTTGAPSHSPMASGAPHSCMAGGAPSFSSMAAGAPSCSHLVADADADVPVVTADLSVSGANTFSQLTALRISDAFPFSTALPITIPPQYLYQAVMLLWVDK